jgi:hypothetical protein
LSSIAAAGALALSAFLPARLDLRNDLIECDHVWVLIRELQL